MNMTNISRRKVIIGGAVAAAHAALAPVVAEANIVTSGYAHDTLTIGLFSADISRLAVNKALHPMVQQFARLEASEAEAVGDLLLGAGAATPKRPDALAETLARLKKMDPGTSFDLHYVRAEIDGHEDLLKIQKRRVAEGKAGIDTTMATLLVPFIETHLAMLQAVENSIA
ncbi:DUF4142 domain-containing protein [Martelella lutilitoris]|uniref:DUF4142 domain-containing protein n=1 Tax=Martelella lutilitoris TaxID=2583532 RepID=A0A5C4JPX4_9HYPH|nr:DUF4142 domain-containing protein [Martelella lutilitoris]TNB47446.1 DUF4142 domain-containing protein [Martelella lutilitoris]